MRNDDHNSLDAELAESSWLLNLARALVGSSQAEDLVQEAYLERLKTPTAPKRPRAFMATLLRRLAAKSQRAEGRRKARETEALARQTTVLDDAAERGQRLAMLWREIEGLDADTRSLLVLRYVDGLEAQHIGRQLDISPNAARQRLHRALEDLRNRLDQRHGGKREDWLRALAPLVLSSPAVIPTAAGASSPLVTKGVIFMGLQKKTLGLAALLLLLLTAAYVATEFVGTEDRNLDQARTADLDQEAKLPRRQDSSADVVAQAESSDDSEDSAAARAATGPVLIHGRVVDSSRQPVADARVTWNASSGSQRRTRTNARGEFELRGFDQDLRHFNQEGLLVARASDGRSGFLALHLNEHVRADGSLVVLTVRTLPSLSLKVRRADAEPAHEAQVRLFNPAGMLTFSGRCDAQGRIVIPGLEAGTHRLLAWQGQDSADLEIQSAAQPAGDFEVQLQTGRSLSVLIRDESGSPVPDARLRLVQHLPASGNLHADPRSWLPSDDEGEVQLKGLVKTEPYEILIEVPGYTSPHNLQLPPAPETRLEVRLEKAPLLSWHLQDGEVPAPRAGEVIRARHQIAGLNSGELKDVQIEVREDQLFLRGYHDDESLILMTSRGEVARVWTSREFNAERSLSFARPRQLEIQLRTGAAPKEGVGVQIRQLGGDPLQPTQLTDATGKVVFDGLYGGPCDVYVGSPGRMHEAGYRVASVDLEEGSKTIEVAIAESQSLILALTHGAKPQLPGAFDLSIEGAQVLAIQEFPDTGLLLVDYRPIQTPARHRLRFNAAGFVSQELDFLSTPDQKLSLDLEKTTSLHAQVIMPRDGKAEICLLRFDKRRQDWLMGDLMTGPIRDQIMSLEIPNLEPGSYRLRDNPSRSWSEAVTINLGDEARALTLDLSQVQEIVAEVRVPKGYNVVDSRLRTTGERVDSSLNWKLFGLPVNSEGKLKLRVDLAQDLGLIGSHPELMTTPKAEAVRATANNNAPIIELAAGPKIEAIVPKDISPSSRLYVFPAGQREEAIHFHSFLHSQGQLRLKALAPGDYDFFFDCAPYAPLWLPNLHLKPSGLDLGEIAFAEGLTLSIELEVPEGAEAPELFLSVASLDGPRYVRFKNAYDENPIRLSGLIPGRHEIEIGDATGPGDQRRIVVEIHPNENPVIRYP